MPAKLVTPGRSKGKRTGGRGARGTKGGTKGGTGGRGFTIETVRRFFCSECGFNSATKPTDVQGKPTMTCQTCGSRLGVTLA